MYVYAPADPIYHLAKGDTRTLCGSFIFGTPEQRRRREDQRLVAEAPTDRICALCSQCARLSGDHRPLLERVTYPPC